MERKARLRQAREERERIERERWEAELASWERGEGGDLPPYGRPNEYDEALVGVVAAYSPLVADRYCEPLPLGGDFRDFRNIIDRRFAWWGAHRADVEAQLLRRLIWAISTFRYEPEPDA